MQVRWQSLAFSALLACACLLAVVTYVPAAQVQLAWKNRHNDPAEVGGYALYFWQSGRQATKIDMGNQTTCVLTGLEAGKTYYFAVIAYDRSGGRESALSNMVSETIPALPRPLKEPVAAYSFEEGHGVTAIDASGHANHGTLAGATWTPKGKFGSALAFDGVNDSVVVQETHALDLTTGMTLEAWVYPTTVTPTREVMVKEGAGIDIYNLYASNHVGRPEINGLIGSTNYTAQGPALVVNTWTHLAGTYDGWMFRLYVNGQEVARRRQGPALQTSSGVLRMGGNSLWGEYFRGRLDEVRIYSRALSASEIQADVQTPVAAAPVMESDEVNVDHTWKRVRFRKPFMAPIVVAKPLSRHEGEPAVVRLRRITPRSFELRVQEWDYLDGTHAPESVGYLVMERGAYMLADGTRVEAGQVEVEWTKFGSVLFQQPFAVVPVVLTAVASVNEADAVATRVRHITPHGFEMRMQEQEDNAPAHARETLTYIAWEPSWGTLDGVTFAVGRAPEEGGSRFAWLPFPAIFGEVPVFLAEMQTANEGNVAALRWRNKTVAGVEVKVEEERSRDREISHAAESLGYVIIMR